MKNDNRKRFWMFAARATALTTMASSRELTDDEMASVVGGVGEAPPPDPDAGFNKVIIPITPPIGPITPISPGGGYGLNSTRGNKLPA